MNTKERTGHEPTLSWLAANVAAFSLVAVAVSFLWVLSYARTVDVPLRVHSDQIANIFPWLWGTLIALAGAPLAFASSIAFISRTHEVSPGTTLHAHLSSIRLSTSEGVPSELRVALWLFAMPLGSGIVFAAGWASLTSSLRPFLWVFLASAMAVGLPALVVLHRRAVGKTRLVAVAIAYSYVLGLSCLVSLLLAWALVTAVGFEREGWWAISIWIATSIWWWFVLVVLTMLPVDRLRDALSKVVVGTILSLVITSLIPDVASRLGASSLRALGIGGGLVVDLDLLIEPPSGTEPTRSKRVTLLLDAGQHLYVRDCDQSDQGVAVIDWGTIVRIKRLPLDGCLATRVSH